MSISKSSIRIGLEDNNGEKYIFSIPLVLTPETITVHIVHKKGLITQHAVTCQNLYVLWININRCDHQILPTY